MIEISKPEDLEKVATTLSRADGVAWPDIVADCAEVVIFGSRAAGVGSRTSDLDILCVGPGKRHRTAHLDMICKNEDEICSDAWLHSELAGHIAAYGKWLRGDGSWKGEAKTGSFAITEKEKRLARLAERVLSYWNRLDPDFHAKYVITLRREVQRLALLRRGAPVCPTPVLDKAWLQSPDSDALVRTVHETRIDPVANDFLLRVMEIRPASRTSNLVAASSIEKALGRARSGQRS